MITIGTRNRSDLKGFFVENAIPTEGNFSELIDAVFNQKDDGIVKAAGNPLAIEGEIDVNSEKTAIHFYDNFATEHAWAVALNPFVDPAAPVPTNQEGFSVNDSAGNSRLFIDKATGNVGIGTVVAGHTLSVAGTGNFTGTLDVGGALDVGVGGALSFGSAKRQMINLYSTTYGIGVQTLTTYFRTNQNFAWYKGGTHSGDELTSSNDPLDGSVTQMVIKDGKVGIGTPTPGARLQVVGGGVATLTGGGFFLLGDTAGTNIIMDNNEIMARDTGLSSALSLQTEGGDLRMHGSVTDISTRFIVTDVGSVGIGTFSPTEKLHVEGGVHVTGTLDVGGALDVTGEATFGGNVGIGTSSPGKALSVIGTIRASDVGEAKYVEITQGSATLGFVNSVGNTRLDFRFANVTKMSILSDGTVGIGTTTPGYKLSVSGMGNFTGNLNVGGVLDVGGALDVTGAATLGGDLDVDGALSFNTTTRQMIHLWNNKGIGVQPNTVYFRTNSRFAWYKAGTHDDVTFDPGTGGAVRMVIGDNGAVGIGTTTPSTRLEVNGTGTATAWNETSDAASKTNVRGLGKCLGKVLALTGVRFNWKDPALGQRGKIGLVAQDVEKVFPQLVSGSDGKKCLNYSGLIAPLIEAIREQQEQIEALKAAITA